MTSWKTTTCGLISAFFGFVLFSPSWFPPWMVDVAKYAMVGGIAALGIYGKDASAHSTPAQVHEAGVEAEFKADMKSASK